MSDFLALVVAYTLPPLIRQPFGLPPSPEGEGFCAGNLVGGAVNSRGRRGRAPALRKVRLTFSKTTEP